MTQISNSYKADYKNALTTAVGGGALWGVGQYFFNQRPFIDNYGNLKDSFVKNMENSFESIKDDTTLKNIELQKNLEKEIDALSTQDEIIEFVKNKKNKLVRTSEEDIQALSEQLPKIEKEKAKNLVKNLFKYDGEYHKYYKDIVDSSYEGNTLVHDASKMSKEKFDLLKNIIKKERLNNALKTAGIFTAVCATCCCLFEYWKSGRNN